MIEVLRLTGYRSWSEYVTETSSLERRLIQESIRAWHRKHDGGMTPGVRGGPSGMT